MLADQHRAAVARGERPDRSTTSHTIRYTALCVAARAHANLGEVEAQGERTPTGGNGSRGWFVERREWAGVLDEVIQNFWRSCSSLLETVNEGREVGGVVVETFCQAAHRQRRARNEAEENFYLIPDSPGAAAWAAQRLTEAFSDRRICPKRRRGPTEIFALSVGISEISLMIHRLPYLLLVYSGCLPLSIGRIWT
jgi:hypothetical protein